jgi:FkbM family methyltransferase
MTLSKLLKKKARAALQMTGFDLIRTEAMNPIATRRAVIMRYHGIQTLLDVGANMGQYSTELREWGFENRILSFEPTSAAFKVLSQRASGDPRWEVFHFAVGAEDGSAEINVASNWGASSSLLPMLEAHKDCAPDTTYVATEHVPVKTLDNALANLIAPDEVLMLKMDVQGFEHFVLRGAASVLPRVRLIECELSFVPLYDGQLLFPQMLEYMAGLGFSPVTFNPIFPHPVTGHALCVDGIFARTEHTQPAEVLLASASA